MMMLRTLAKALGLLALATAAPASAKSSNSSTSELRYGFGECVDNKRTLYYFTDDNVTCSTAGNGDKLLSKRKLTHYYSLCSMSEPPAADVCAYASVL